MVTESPESELLADDLHGLLFGVRRSARYHLRRRRFFEQWHSATNFIGVATGSAAVASVVGEDPSWALGSGVIVALFSAFDLVVGTAERAREHSDLATRFVLLEKDIVLSGAPTKESIRTYTAKRLEIEADEPPILRTLDRLCHNELCRAMGMPAECFVKIPWYQRRLAQWINYEAENPEVKKGRSVRSTE